MKNILITIDKNLSFCKQFAKDFIIDYAEIIVEGEMPSQQGYNDQIKLRYAHDITNLALLTPLSDFNTDTKKGIQVKTIFFSWFSWKDHYEMFSPHFYPGNFYLWDSTLCSNLQLPCELDLIKEAITKLTLK